MQASPIMPDAVIDTHHHLWHLADARYPWLQEAYDASAFILGDYRPLCEDFGVPALRAAFGGVPVVATVHVEAERARDEALLETTWLHRQWREHGFPCAVVAWVDLLAPDTAEQLARHAAWPLVRGIRFKPVTAGRVGERCDGRGSLRDPAWLPALERLHRQGLSWDLRVPFWHLQDAARMLADAPPVAVALEHTGLPWDRSAAGLRAWRAGMEALAALPQVQVKLSEFGLRDAAWNEDENAALVADAIRIFGPARCMFGSNFPVASLRIDYPGLIRMTARGMDKAALDAAARNAIWQGNARAFYRIAGADREHGEGGR